MCVNRFDDRYTNCISRAVEILFYYNSHLVLSLLKISVKIIQKGEILHRAYEEVFLTLTEPDRQVRTR